MDAQYATQRTTCNKKREKKHNNNARVVHVSPSCLGPVQPLTPKWEIISTIYCWWIRENWDEQFLRSNQTNLCVENYQGLMDHIHNNAAVKDIPVGKIVILPSTFKGSLRNMQQNFQDAMAIVAKHGKPDLFLTVTCNPIWTEIQENL